MTSIKTFNGEKFEKNSWRYIIFATVFIWIILMSILSWNFVWAVVLFFLLWWYLYYTLNINQSIEIKINGWVLIVWDKTVARSNYIWFVIEIDVKSDSIKNLVFVWDKSHNIFTINDDINNVSSFLNELVKYIPHLDNYDQSFFEKVSRKFQL